MYLSVNKDPPLPTEAEAAAETAMMPSPSLNPLSPRVSNVSSADSNRMLTVEGAQKQPPLPGTIKCTVALKRFSRWAITPTGFLITVYMLNVVAWGGMLFLLMCNAAPAMCHPTCDDINSPRRIWIEIDSQILNGLFCVTGFGLAPFRLRDLYWWCFWRFGRTQSRRNDALARLAAAHANWFRLPRADLERGETEAVLTPIPPSKAPKPPLTGVYAPATASWKMTFVVHNMIWNTILQGCLAGCMWGMNRHVRPPWTTGLFIGLACVVAMAAGGMIMWEGNRVDKIEGKPISAEEVAARRKLGLLTEET
ncbi:DUF2985 domain-containing protein [Aspergillus melleus]|uniref:DUF2985 domain-containing protein n=1 Tax=Aspergillus melleus TaxID=138277 RepID=UPI001E8CAA23|nr:uncharacterized protein LDX57_003039 [Aspergillus melleus]KAH8425281.1 hypothetical protein LDX57_003039 [Aspergillus melleus]